MQVTVLALLLVFLNASAVASTFAHYVVEVMGAGARIKMDDGFIWEVPQDTFLGYVMNDYQGEANTWVPGDEVVMQFIDIGDRYRRIVFKLKNLRTNKSISVKYRAQDEQWTAPSIISIEKNWGSNFITLSDGTYWDINGFHESRPSAQWSIGERVVVYKGYHLNEFVLINPDYGLKRDWFGAITPYHSSCVEAFLAGTSTE